MTLTILGDTEVQRAVRAELAWDPNVKVTHIGVSVKEGVVTLSGHVASYAEKYAAEDAAKRVRAVRAVANELDVHLPEDNQRTDEDIAGDVVRALKWNILVPHDRIKVTVSKGWVTLEGQVKWQFQMKAAEWVVRYVPGVRGVSNELTIEPRVLPADVKARIQDALLHSAEVDASGITVKVEGSHVILRGKVRSWVEKIEAERTAWSVPGVTLVDNQIVVAP